MLLLLFPARLHTKNQLLDNHFKAVRSLTQTVRRVSSKKHSSLAEAVRTLVEGECSRCCVAVSAQQNRLSSASVRETSSNWRNQADGALDEIWCRTLQHCRSPIQCSRFRCHLLRPWRSEHLLKIQSFAFTGRRESTHSAQRYEQQHRSSGTRASLSLCCMMTIGSCQWTQMHGQGLQESGIQAGVVVGVGIAAADSNVAAAAVYA